jgi:lysophospholipase L1-like esterase
MRLAAALAALAATAGACVRSASTTAPTELGASPRPAVACPAPVVSQTLTGLPIRVTFALPQTAGGVLPLSASCAPPSGAAFPIGTTTVTCTVTDALQEGVSCTFTVRVLGPPRLSATRFLAFGDSITFGFTGDSYPSRLQAKLAARYQTQGISVVNAGLAGEDASPGGQQRLPSTLDAHRPAVLLLMEGSNDLNQGAGGASRALDALTAMVRLAKGRGIVVLLATIPPQRAGGQRNFTAPQVPGFNDSIRALAQREGATLVDIYAAMVGDPSLIGPDDLHPTTQGHEVMAQTFFMVIQQMLELPPE